jgi:hydrogenase maturation protease
MTDGILVVGYGNALRTDDGFGWHAAEILAADPRLDGATVLARHQLTPELALDFIRATFVVLIDASHGHPPGTFTIERVERAGRAGTAWSHHLDPASSRWPTNSMAAHPTSASSVLGRRRLRWGIGCHPR